MTNKKRHPANRRMSFLFKDDDSDQNIERMWVTPAQNGLFVIDNIPFYAVGFALNDVVAGEETKEDLWFKDLVSESGHSTVRVVMLETEYRDSVCAHINSLGCDIEISNLQVLFAVDVPPTVSWCVLTAYLIEMMGKGVIGYEESAISTHHRRQLKQSPEPKDS